MEENVLMMRCTKCGEMNRLPVVHCKKCGARLDFETAEKRMIEASGSTVQQQIRTAIRLTVAALLLLVLLLVVWPGQMTRNTGAEMDAKRYRMKRELLLEALNRGLPAAQVIDEKDINAHLREVVAVQPPAKGFLSPVVKDVGARFFPNRAEVFIAVQRGPFTFTGHFFAKAKGSELTVSGARAGHLPLPGFLGWLYANATSGIFRQMKDEARILRHLDGANLDNESIELLVKAGN